MKLAAVDVAVVMLVDYDILVGEEALVSLVKVLEHYAELQSRHLGKLSAVAAIDPRRKEV